MKEHLFNVPNNKKVRVILDTDAGAEGDDQFAIVHALLTPKFDVVGIIAEQFGPEAQSNNSMEKSYAEIVRVLENLGLDQKIPVYRGEQCALADEKTPGDSEGARFIIEEALKEDNRPLFVLNMGAITNLASAYLINPEIADRIVAVWIGGGGYPVGSFDFNLGNDINAGNVIFESDMELWQIPLTAYTMMAVSFYELFERVKPYGKIGEYLIKKLMEVNEAECSMNFDNWDFAKNLSKGAKTVFIRTGEGWSLGDSPAVGVLLTPQGHDMEIRKAQRINRDGTYGDYIRDQRMIRVYHSIDSRVILEDFFAKLKYHYGM